MKRQKRDLPKYVPSMEASNVPWRKSSSLLDPLFANRSGNSGVLELIHWSDAIGYPWPENVSKATLSICSSHWEDTWFAVGRSARYDVLSLTTRIAQYFVFMRPSFNCEKGLRCRGSLSNYPTATTQEATLTIFFHLHFTFFFLPLLLFFLLQLHSASSRSLVFCSATVPVHLRQLSTGAAYFETH